MLVKNLASSSQIVPTSNPLSNGILYMQRPQPTVRGVGRRANEQGANRALAVVATVVKIAVTPVSRATTVD
jgi:hypothetical protein